jgi:CHAT domain-containing protein/tetratricopeptide (TPR) repeat protein
LNGQAFDEAQQFVASARGVARYRLLEIIVGVGRRLGEYEKAIAAANKVVSDNSIAGASTRIACLAQLGRIYLQMNQLEDAFSAFDRAMRLDQEQNGGDQFTVLGSGLADAWLKAGEAMKSVLLCERVLDRLIERFPKAVDVLNNPDASRLMAERRISQAMAAEALRRYRFALLLLEGADISDSRGEFLQVISFHRGRLYATLSEFDHSNEFLEIAVKEARNRSDVAVEMLAHEQLGRVAAKQGDPEKAVKKFAKAIELLESGLSKLRVESFHVSRRHSEEMLFELAIDAALAAGKPHIAWDFSERGRARVLLDLLANTDLLRRSPRATRQDEEYFQISRELGALIAQMFEFGSSESVMSEKLRGRYRELSERQAAVAEQMRRESPLETILTEARIADAESLAARLEPGMLLIEFFVGSTTITAFVVDRDGLSIFRQAMPNRTLSQKVERLRELTFARDPGAVRDVSVVPQTTQSLSETVEDERRELSAALFRLLLGPVASRLVGISHLCIVPHGPLALLPFAALGEDRFLTEQVAISYAPSASSLSLLLDASRQMAVRRAVIFANPVRTGSSLALPYAEEEAHSVARHFEQVEIHTGTNATSTRFLAEAPSADVLHLACHATFNTEHPLLSMLLLADEKARPCGLDAFAVCSLNLQANLVTLSACETAMGHWGEGAEAIGLIRAFLTAGARSVLASQWPVEDEATAELMNAFYENLRSGHGKAEALRRAQLHLLARGDRCALRSWAAFVLYGDWRSWTANHPSERGKCNA